MRKILNAMKPFIQEISHDFMLCACLIAPIIMGIVFKFFLPLLEKILCSEFQKNQILSPYFLIFDLLLSIMTPIMFCFSGVMTVLLEKDNGTAKYLCVTPLGKSGYLISRIGIPSVIAFVYDIICLSIFSITKMTLILNLTISICAILISLISAMIVIVLAKNKLEGMALIKLCGIFVLGIPAVYFIPNYSKYIFAILPSFWLTVFAQNQNYFYLIPTISVSFIWISLLATKFKIV